MIIGHIATGLLVQALSAARLGPKAIPIWTTTFGSTLNDLLTGLFLLLGIESIRPNPKFTPLGIEFTYADWSHSFSMILIWGLIWASFASWMTSKTKGGQTTSSNVWYYSLLSVLVHTLADYLVHLPDMALFPNSKIKLGAKLWLYSPVGAWAMELAITALAVGLMYRYYGNAFRFPGVLLIAMHLMNYPGAKTNIPFMLGSTLTGTALRLTVGAAFLMTYTVPNLLISHKLDRPLLEPAARDVKAQ